MAHRNSGFTMIYPLKMLDLSMFVFCMFTRGYLEWRIPPTIPSRWTTKLLSGKTAGKTWVNSHDWMILPWYLSCLSPVWIFSTTSKIKHLGNWKPLVGSFKHGRPIYHTSPSKSPESVHQKQSYFIPVKLIATGMEDFVTSLSLWGEVFADKLPKVNPFFVPLSVMSCYVLHS